MEGNLDGVKVEDLNITYQPSSGIVFPVKNDPTFKAAKKKMKPELKLTCTLNPSTKALIIKTN